MPTLPFAEVLDKSFAFPPWLKICGWLLLLLPSVMVVMHDVIKSYFSPEEGIRFSICHAVFFAASLYRISFNAAVRLELEPPAHKLDAGLQS